MDNEGLSYYNSEDFKSLLENYERMSKEKGHSYFESYELMDLAEYFIRFNMPEKAKKAIEYNIKLHPFQTEPLVLKAKMLLNEGDLKGAQRIADSIKEVDDHDVALLKAEVLIKLGKKTEACKLLKRALVGDCDKCDEYVDVLNLLLDNDCLDETRQCLDMALKLFPDDIDLWELEGEYYHLKGDKEKAIEIYNKVLDMDPYYTTAWEQLGRLYFEDENFEKAAECFDFELTIDENEAYACLMLAHCSFYMGNYKKAEGLYKRLIDLFPDAAVSLYYYAMCLIEEDRNDEAVNSLKKALNLVEERSQEFVVVQINIALSYMKLGKKKQALRYVDDALDIESDNADLLILKGHILLELRDFKNAMSCFLKAMDSPDKKSEEVMFMMAVSLLENEFVEVAYYSFQKLLSYDEFEIERAYAYIALCCWVMNKKEELKEYVEKSMASDSSKLFSLFKIDFNPDLSADEFIELLREKED